MMFGTPCSTCGAATAIGRSKKGLPLRVCVTNGHKQEEPTARPAKELEPTAFEKWWNGD